MANRTFRNLVITAAKILYSAVIPVLILLLLYLMRIGEGAVFRTMAERGEIASPHAVWITIFMVWCVLFFSVVASHLLRFIRAAILSNREPGQRMLKFDLVCYFHVACLVFYLIGLCALLITAATRNWSALPMIETAVHSWLLDLCIVGGCYFGLLAVVDLLVRRLNRAR